MNADGAIAETNVPESLWTKKKLTELLRQAVAAPETERADLVARMLALEPLLSREDVYAKIVERLYYRGVNAGLLKRDEAVRQILVLCPSETFESVVRRMNELAAELLPAWTDQKFWGPIDRILEAALKRTHQLKVQALEQARSLAGHRVMKEIVARYEALCAKGAEPVGASADGAPERLFSLHRQIDPILLVCLKEEQRQERLALRYVEEHFCEVSSSVLRQRLHNLRRRDFVDAEIKRLALTPEELETRLRKAHGANRLHEEVRELADATCYRRTAPLYDMCEHLGLIAPGERRVKIWTEADWDYIVAHPDATRGELARALGCTRRELQDFLRRKGRKIARPRTKRGKRLLLAWPRETEERLVAAQQAGHLEETIAQICRETGRRRKYVYALCRRILPAPLPPRPTRQLRPWSRMDDKFLFDNFDTCEFAYLAKQLARTEKSVRRRVQQLGLTIGLGEAYTPLRLMQELHVRWATVQAWLDNGELSIGYRHRIQEPSLHAFLARHACEFLAKEKHPIEPALRHLVESVLAENAFTPRQLEQALQVDAKMMEGWLANGELALTEEGEIPFLSVQQFMKRHGASLAARAAKPLAPSLMRLFEVPLPRTPSGYKSKSSSASGASLTMAAHAS